MDEEQEEREKQVFADFIEKMEDWARPLGLYLMHAEPTAVREHAFAGAETPGRRIVHAVFTLGDEAFSDRVQHPERYTDEAMLAGMEHATLEADAERIMQRYAESGALFENDDETP